MREPVKQEAHAVPAASASATPLGVSGCALENISKLAKADLLRPGTPALAASAATSLLQVRHTPQPSQYDKHMHYRSFVKPQERCRGRDPRACLRHMVRHRRGAGLRLFTCSCARRGRSRLCMLC